MPHYFLSHRPIFLFSWTLCIGLSPLTAKALDAREASLDYRQGQMTAVIKHVLLETVLKQVTEKTGVRFEIKGLSRNEVWVSSVIEKQPLEQAILMIFERFSYVIDWGSQPVQIIIVSTPAEATVMTDKETAVQTRHDQSLEDVTHDKEEYCVPEDDSFPPRRLICPPI